MKKILIFILGFTIIIALIIGLNMYFGWYAYEKWEYRRDTRGEVEESVYRGVFIKKLDFIIVPDSLMREFDTQDTLFYIEKGYTYGKYNMNDTKILSLKDTKYPYQLIRRGIDVVYLKRDNLAIQDSISYFPIFLKNIENDTIYFRLLQRKTQNLVDPNLTDTIGIVKVF